MNLILKQKIKTKKKINNYLVSILLNSISLSFTTLGIISYLGSKNFLFFHIEEISFMPQGITTFIYGIIGIFISNLQTLNTKLKIGEGYNKIYEKNIILNRKNYIKDIKIKLKIKNILWKIKYFENKLKAYITI